MEVQNDTIFCVTSPSPDASRILPGTTDLHLVICVLPLIKIFYSEKTESSNRSWEVLPLQQAQFPSARNPVVLSYFSLCSAPLSLSLQGNDPLSHAAHILEFTAWLISQGHAQPKYWSWSSLARQLAQKHFRRERRGGRNPLASLRTKLVYY